jgi:DNA-directed RNA polymerase specialized sigma24 family protein
MKSKAEEGPSPTDTEGWRRAIEADRLGLIRGESIVAAIQDIGPDGDDKVRGDLMLHVTDRITRILTKFVGREKPNRKQIIERVQFALVQAILRPASADGKGLRAAFYARVIFRATDAIRHEGKTIVREPSYDQYDSLPREPEADTASTTEQQQRDIDRLLQQAVPDLRKRLAFSLDLEQVPFDAKKGASIAKALGVNEKTARDWVDEVKKELKGILEDNNE